MKRYDRYRFYIFPFRNGGCNLNIVFQNARAYSFCGTIEYMAPEIVRGGGQGHDMVYSLISLYPWRILMKCIFIFVFRLLIGGVLGYLLTNC